jgi:nicotinamide-nucleotide amidase
MKFFGTGESDMERRLGAMIERNRQPRVGITVSGATISLRITAISDSDLSCEAMIQRTRAEILELVPEYYFGDGEDFEQHHAIDAMLRARGESMMVIELGRAAPLGDWFASLGETPAYRGGISLATSDDLQVMFGTVGPSGSTESADSSEQQAIETAKQRFGVDWILLVDGYPELDKSGDRPQAASAVRFVVASPDGKQLTSEHVMGGHPQVLQPRIAKAGMAWLRTVLRQSES